MVRGSEIRKGARSGAGAGWRRVLLSAALVVALAGGLGGLWSGDASAQLPGLERLLGGSAPASSQSSSDQAAPDRAGQGQAEFGQAPPGPSSLGQSSPAQSLAPRFRSSEPPSVDDYARLLSSPAARRETLPPATLSIDTIEDYIDVFRARLAAIIYRAPTAFGELETTMQAASPTGKPVHFIGIAAFAGLLLIVGRAVTELFNVFIARPIFVRMQRPDPVGYGDKLPVLAARLMLSLVAVGVCLATAVAAGLAFYDGHKPTLVTVLAVFSAYGSIIMAHTFWRMVLAPFLPDYRLPAIGDRPARALYRWLSLASITAILSSAFSFWVEALGLPREVLVVVTAGTTLASVVLLAVGLRANRKTITAILVGGGRGSGVEGADVASARASALDTAPELGEGSRRAVQDGPAARAAPLTWLQQGVAFGWGPVTVLALLVTWAELAFRLVMGIDAGAERILAPFLVLVVVMLVYASVVYVSDRIFARRRRVRDVNAASRAAEAAEAAQAAQAAQAGPAGALVRSEADVARPYPDQRYLSASAGELIPAGSRDPGIAAARDVDGRLERTDGPTLGIGDAEGGDDEGYSGGPPAIAPQVPERPPGGLRSFE
ncbi:MAG: hypothetical protein AAF899_04555, partial [Pseudomonadota bacterium]